MHVALQGSFEVSRGRTAARGARAANGDAANMTADLKHADDIFEALKAQLEVKRAGRDTHTAAR